MVPKELSLNLHVHTSSLSFVDPLDGTKGMGVALRLVVHLLKDRAVKVDFLSTSNDRRNATTLRTDTSTDLNLRSTDKVLV